MDTTVGDLLEAINTPRPKVFIRATPDSFGDHDVLVAPREMESERVVFQGSWRDPEIFLSGVRTGMAQITTEAGG